MIVLDCAWNMLSKHKPIYETLEANGTYDAISWVLALVSLTITIFAVLTAFRCNPENKLLYGLIALFFSVIYLIQHGIRKFIFKEKGYCT